jgi:hypothetical protein
MDRYLKKDPQKREFEFTKLGPAVCLLGGSGIGKTWAAHQALQPLVELTSEILRSRQGTIDFLDKIARSSINVVLDEYECISDLAGLSEITKPPTNGIFCVISQIPVKFDFKIETYHFPVPTPEDIQRIAPGVKDIVVRQCRGDLRYALRSLEFQGDAPDDFQGPRDFVSDLVSVHSRTNPILFMGHPVQEPGNIASILHENYVDALNCRYEVVSDFFSQGDVLESRVYAGVWDLYPYYNIFSCVLPAIEIGHTLRLPLRPGSTWTKYQNMCMRTKRISAMSKRIPGKKLTIDELMLIRDIAESGNTGILREYGFLPQDLDVLNHLSPLRKIKVRNLAALKKSLQ